MTSSLTERIAEVRRLLDENRAELERLGYA